MKDITNMDGLNVIRTNIEEAIEKDLPKILPDSLPTVMRLDADMLPLSIRDYVVDIANRQQCPIDFVAVTAVCGLAAVLGRKALMCPKQNDDWEVTPNLWGAIIGRPSAMKSPSMKEALKSLHQIDNEAAKQYESEKENYEVDKQFSELNKSSAKEKAKAHIGGGKENEARAVLKSALFNEPMPTRRRLIINDASVEKLGELLNENTNGLILVRDELFGWLAKLAREEYQSERAFYLECFDGNGQFVYDRIGRGTIDIKNTTLSVIGGIQPGRISPLIRDAMRGTVDDGLVQRLQLSVWPDDVGDWTWNDRSPNYVARNNYFQTFENLYALNIEKQRGEPKSLKFSEQILRGLENRSITPDEAKTLFEVVKSYCSTTLVAEMNRRLDVLEENENPRLSTTSEAFK